jgi:hypothetical protein
MRRTRIKIILICAVVLTALAGIAAPTITGLYQLWFPSDVDWDSKVGWRLCNSAIAAWPGRPLPSCEHLHMCANEGALSESERRTLREMVTAKPGCGPP